MAEQFGLALESGEFIPASELRGVIPELRATQAPAPQGGRMAENTNTEREATGPAEVWLRSRYGAYRGHFAWRELEEAFNAGRASLPLPAAGQEPVAWRLRNTAYKSNVYEYFSTKYLAECRKIQFNAQVDGTGLQELTPLYAAPQPAVAGWVMVPADPTLDMGWAYLDAARESEPFKTHSFNHDGYRAMLKAAPLPPAPSTEGESRGTQ